VVAVSVANQAAGQTPGLRDAEAEGAARARVDKLTRELQELGTSLRMIPLLSTFRKMMRLSRDLGKRCRKSLQFSFSGEGTELDRTIVQQIQDPLLHILRNAIDHGLEAPEERLKAGKPKVAYVGARAYQKGGSFFIEVADDGRGFDADLILRKARAVGLVPEGRDLTREEIVELVFEPGFTTAETVTSISGRGVGMDVVKRTAERLGGSASIESVTGKGTVVTLRLPLTVAMIEGMVIRVGAQRFIVPTLALTRVHQPRPGEIETVSQRQEFLSFKERLIPLVRLGRVFEIEGTETDASRGVIVIVEGRGRPAGLLVDELLGQQQIVIKGLGKVLQNIPGIAGGAVMQDGKVGLILDVQGILELAHAGRDALLRAVG
jgi:two-component system chemotaxis sensor kinase CheA